MRRCPSLLLVGVRRGFATSRRWVLLILRRRHRLIVLYGTRTGRLLNLRDRDARANLLRDIWSVLSAGRMAPAALAFAIDDIVNDRIIVLGCRTIRNLAHSDLFSDTPGNVVVGACSVAAGAKPADQLFVLVKG